MFRNQVCYKRVYNTGQQLKYALSETGQPSLIFDFTFLSRQFFFQYFQILVFFGSELQFQFLQAFKIFKTFSFEADEEKLSQSRRYAEIHRRYSSLMLGVTCTGWESSIAPLPQSLLQTFQKIYTHSLKILFMSNFCARFRELK